MRTYNSSSLEEFLTLLMTYHVIFRSEILVMGHARARSHLHMRDLHLHTRSQIASRSDQLSIFSYSHMTTAGIATLALIFAINILSSSTCSSSLLSSVTTMSQFMVVDGRPRIPGIRDWLRPAQIQLQFEDSSSLNFQLVDVDVESTNSNSDPDLESLGWPFNLPESKYSPHLRNTPSPRKFRSVLWHL